MAHGHHKAAALLFGRAIDKACDVKAQEKRLGMNLKKKLKAALDANHISRTVYEAAEAVRGVRNFSAHGDFDLQSGADVPDLPEEDADATCTAAVGVLIEMFVKGGLVEALRQKYPAR